MEQQRRREIDQLLEACRETDNSDLEAEKTAVIAELLAETNRMHTSKEPNERLQDE